LVIHIVFLRFTFIITIGFCVQRYEKSGIEQKKTKEKLAFCSLFHTFAQKIIK